MYVAAIIEPHPRSDGEDRPQSIISFESASIDHAKQSIHQRLGAKVVFSEWNGFITRFYRDQSAHDAGEELFGESRNSTAGVDEGILLAVILERNEEPVLIGLPDGSLERLTGCGEAVVAGRPRVDRADRFAAVVGNRSRAGIGTPTRLTSVFVGYLCLHLESTAITLAKASRKEFRNFPFSICLLSRTSARHCHDLHPENFHRQHGNPVRC